MHTSSYLSPASLLLPAAATGKDSLENFPPTFIVYGGAERLAKSIEILWDRLQLARKDPQGIEDKFVEGVDCVHDFMIFPWQAEEAGIVYEKLDIWLRELLASEPISEIKSPRWDKLVQETRKRRASLKIGKSPVMGPVQKDRGVLKMVGEMSSEGMR
jgi:acetyl esterase/lipase